jgi:S1-C subfamily serine protease
MKVTTFKRVLILFSFLVIVIAAVASGVVLDRKVSLPFVSNLLPKTTTVNDNVKVVKEDSIVIDVAEKVSPSVVTVSVQTPTRNVIEFSPNGGFQQRAQGGQQQDIGSGFVVTSDGLIVTNKHVVSDDRLKYKVVTSDDKEYDVVKITKDPANDLAIIKIDAKGLTPIEMGDSDTIKVGQFAIAIGTALGEFRHTVTTGVISGLGRGITAGSAYEGFVERLDNVIQTDAAINPGNSGGPLLNSTGQAVAVNVAVAQGAQNIGFAIPINVVKKGLEQFNNNGAFASKPFLGVQYQMISKQSALMNEVPQGAYVAEVVPGSPAEKAGIKVDDIITELNGQKIADNKDGLAGVIATLKASDTVTVKLWRDGKVLEVTTTLSSPQQ